MNYKDSNFELINSTKSKLPSLDFESMKDSVLGKDYSLSVAVVSKEEIKNINNKYRNKDEPTDILSFSLGENSGEIFINIDMTKEEAKKFERNYENFLAFLFIHGLVHLKGYDHGSKMESIEKKFREVFGV